MSSDKVPGAQPASLSADTAARRRGRMGLAVPWENIPWWGLIILIVGVIVGYSVLTSTQYIDAIYFLFDLPWNKQALTKTEAGDSGQWSMTVKPALGPGTYSIYAEYQNEAGETVGRSDVYRIEIPKGASAIETTAIATPSETPTRVDTTTPTLAGTAPAGATVILWDDFSNQPLRILGRIWSANGVMLTIRVTIIAFAGALVMGLIFGLMRVSSRSPNLTVNAGRRLLVGLGLIALIWLAVPSWRSPGSILPVAIVVEAIMFLSPAMPYTLSTLYVEMVRGVPMLVIILYMGFAITPALRNASQNSFLGEVDLRGLPAAVIGLSFGYGAYLAEVYRAGIESIPKGQMEAARSLGMSYFQAMRYVILPQAIRVVLPPLGNDFIAMLKDTSLISVIALPEVLQQGRLWISRNFRAFEGFNSVAMLYLVMTLLLSLLVRFIERKSALPGR
jgi:ABC-type amino acid transport system permease subunit